MDANAALAGLLELSTQVVEAVVVGPGGVEASSVADPTRAESLARAGTALLEAAGAVRPGAPAVERVAVDRAEGALLVVRRGTRSLVATLVPEPTLGLVAYDARTALDGIDDAPRPRRTAQRRDADG